MSIKRREYEKADSRGRTGLRAVKRPGEARHADRSESAKDIARRLAIAKREKRLKDIQHG